MITNLPKWAAPGLATVLGGVALIVLLSPTACMAQSVTAGTPPASQVVRPAAPSSSITVLAPPRVSDYWITATRQPGGVIVFDGYVPDDATRKALGATEGADTNWLKLGSGEPDAYQSALDFGMAALAHLSEGRFALRSNIVTLSGIARSSTDYEALTKLVGANPPPGVVLARNEITAPVATTFLWSASKAADGAIALSGMVPNADIRAQLIAAAGQSPTQSIMYASGAPADFATSAVSGLALLKRLDTGELTFGPDGWVLKGRAKSDADKTAIETDVAASEPKNWSVNLEAAKPIIAAAPPPAVVVPEPATAPSAPVESHPWLSRPRMRPLRQPPKKPNPWKRPQLQPRQL